jgi:hypothetical protein
MTTTTFSTRLAAVVRERGYGIDEICATTGDSPSVACRKLTGEIPFTVPDLAEIADTLGVQVSEILCAAEVRA